MRIRGRAGRAVAAVLAATVLASAVASCAKLVGGTAVYTAGDSNPRSAPVRVSDLQSLVLSADDLRAMFHAPDLAPLNVPAVRSLAADVISDPSCGAVVQTGWLATYAASGHLGDSGLVVQDAHDDYVTETVASFSDPAAAQGFVGAVIAQWKACVERSVTLTAQGSTANWMGFGPSRADGVDVLLVRREGGRGAACSRAIGSGSNVTADVDVCGPDETVVNDNAAGLVTAILSRIPG
jgi:serine/threonine kinase PknH